MRIITLITDFGSRDPYVGSMKGVILSVNPAARIVDISHEVGPGDVREAAYLLLCTYRYFPRRTVHVVVVDPGVGSTRKILCLRAQGTYFLAPDNGILSPIFSSEKPLALREVTNARYFRKEISSTFHGRDKFAPVAAHLSRSNIFNRLGPPVKRMREVRWPTAKIIKKSRGSKKSPASISGSVIHIDRFGNVITNLDRGIFRSLRTPQPRIFIRSREIRHWARFYAEIPKNELAGLINSGGFLEIAANQASCQKKLKARVGDEVRVEGEF